MSASKPPARPDKAQPPAASRSSSADIEAFVQRARAVAPAAAGGSGRLILALDATMSRQPTWDLACRLQAEMFDTVGRTANLAVQLVYFRGFGECRASRFVSDTGSLKTLMTKIDCRGGQTQIGKVLSHALKEAQRGKVGALVYIGDAMEENVDALAAKAGELGLRGVPVFVFQEGRDAGAETAFREIARLTKGAWFRFDHDSAGRLAKLLSAAAMFATGYLAAAALVVLVLAYVATRANPAYLADGLRLAGPAVLVVAAIVLLIAGRGGISASLVALAVGWYTAMRRRRAARPTPGGRSHVRTAALEMELDHDTGGLEGLVLAGRFEGRELSALSLGELLTLRGELAADGESLQLLETYLDGRFPVWRDDAEADAHRGQGSAPASGAMSKQEAYKILGLEPGASAADIRKAHRRLMQRLHPDIGGTSFLAARINEAKDVLLSEQD